MHELLVAEVLDHLDVRGEVRRRPGATVADLDVLGPETRQLPEAPRREKAAGTRFIAGEPMNRATKTFAGLV